MIIQNNKINRKMNVKIKNEGYKKTHASVLIPIYIFNRTEIPFYFRAQRPFIKIMDNLRNNFKKN